MNVALTKSRALNALRCYCNYALSLLGLVRITHKPTFISVEPAAVCQLRCPECPVGMRGYGIPVTGYGTMPMEVWHRVLAEIRDTAFVVQFYFQGEPLLNKELPAMIAEAHNAGLYTIVSTNAQAMTPKMAEELAAAGLNRIIISMDGLTEETYSAYRVGGSVEKCKEAIAWLRKAKRVTGYRLPVTGYRLPVIELQCLRLKSNEQEWASLRRMYKELGADRLTFKTAQLHDYSDGHPLMPTNRRYSRYEQTDNGHYRRKQLRQKCLRVWSGVVVTTNGEVLPCCYDKAHAYAYGNIMDTPLAELFANAKALAFRRAALKEQPDICKECWR